MKTRRVVVTVEVDTDAKVADLRKATQIAFWREGNLTGWIDPIQIQVNVVAAAYQEKKPVKARKA